MIKLYQFPSAWDLPNPSPFCMKLEVFMRLADIPYEIVTLADPRKAPKGKLPYIEHEGRQIADSHICLRYLTETFEVELDEHLSPAEKATGFALQKMLDEHFYWCVIYSRWMDDRIWPNLRQALFGNLSPVVRQILPNIVRRNIRKTLHAQGIGRHDQAEIYRQAAECLQAVSEFLGDKPFLFGEQPTSHDATVYRYVANAIQVPFDTEMQRAKDRLPNLMPYCRRMQQRCFGD